MYMLPTEIDTEDTFESLAKSDKRGVRRATTAKKKRRDMERCKHWRQGGFPGMRPVMSPGDIMPVWVPTGHIRLPHDSRRRKFWKRYSNRVIRRQKMTTDWTRKGEHHRAIEYWYTVLDY